MEERRRAASTPCTPTTPEADAKVRKEKDLHKVWSYFRYKVGTSLDCALSLGILRNSVTWYIDELEKMGELQAVYRKPDRTTSFLAKHYSADKSLWKKRVPQELELFDVPCVNEIMQDLAHAQIKDAQSEEYNIMAAWATRKEAYNE